MDYNTLVVLVGVTSLGATAGVVGSFMVLRRRALAGDALAHASLPGLVIAFLLFERRELYILLTGALISALVGIAVVSFLRRYTRIKEDAAIGIVLSVFFGAGIVLSRLVQNRTTAGSKAGLDSFLMGKTAGIIFQDALVIFSVSVMTLLLVTFLFKEFKLVTFDTGFARAQGWPTALLDLIILALVAVNVMIGLPAVGVVLVAALLILPAAAARFWTERLEQMVLLSALIGAATGIMGTLLSASLRNLPAGPVIILTGAAFLIVSMLLAPKRGLIARWVSENRFQREVEERKLLRELFEAWEKGQGWPESVQIARRSGEKSALNDILRRGWVKREGTKLALTADGFVRARQAVEGNRLWHMLLEEYPEIGGPLADLSEESVDKVLPVDLVNELVRKVKERGRWPMLPASIRAEAT